MMREVRWERMFYDELEQAFERCPVVYFAYGLCEPHGPQNTLGLDALKAHAIACQTARKFGGIVAPADYWHVHELGGYALWGRRAVGEVPRKWMTAVPPWMHFKNVCYHIRAADAIGFHAAILLTGHYGPNWKDLKRLVSLIQPHVGARLYALPDFEANQPGFEQDQAGRSTGDHAGKVETSLLWALEPACVDVSRLPDQDAPGPHFAMGKTAHECNRLIGERMVRDEVDWLGGKAGELLEAYARLRPTHRLLGFDAVEHFWQEEIAPVLHQFESMQGCGPSEDTMDGDSVWFRNWRAPDRYREHGRR